MLSFGLRTSVACWVGVLRAPLHHQRHRQRQRLPSARLRLRAEQELRRRNIDPEVTTGYDHTVGAGNPLFRSLLLPSDIGDGIHDIRGFDANDHLVLLGDDVHGGTSFDFGVNGLSRFRVTGTQTPITTFVDPSAIPEAPTLALALLSVLALRLRPARRLSVRRR
jgi:hypothetical protein